MMFLIELYLHRFFLWFGDDVNNAQEFNTTEVTTQQVEDLYEDAKICEEVKDTVHEKVIKLKEKKNTLHMEGSEIIDL